MNKKFLFIPLLAFLAIGVQVSFGNNGVPQALDEAGIEFDGINEFLIALDDRLIMLESITITNGTDGAQGIQGIKGDTGDTGSQGIQGEQALGTFEWDQDDYIVDIVGSFNSVTGVTKTCPVGSTIVSGGGKLSTAALDAGVVVVENHPHGTTQWKYIVSGETAVQNIPISVFTICYTP